jgi:hypothetical protein
MSISERLTVLACVKDDSQKVLQSLISCFVMEKPIDFTDT